MSTWKTTWKASRALKAYEGLMARGLIFSVDYGDGEAVSDLEEAIDCYGRALTIASRMIPKGSDADDLDSRMRWETRAKMADTALGEMQTTLRRRFGLY